MPSTLLESVSLVKDIVTIFAALVAAMVAWKGFNSWKKQLNWKTQYELAQRLSTATYKVRDNLALARYFISSDTGTWEEISEKNWARIRDSVIELEAIVLEAEAMWGKEIIDLCQTLKQCAVQYFRTSSLPMYRAKHHTIPVSEEELDREQKIMWSTGEDEDNFFTNQIEKSVNEIEKFLRPYFKV
jgi:hypothetical protein